MARRSSKRSGSTSNQRKSGTTSETTATDDESVTAQAQTDADSLPADTETDIEDAETLSTEDTVRMGAEEIGDTTSPAEGGSDTMQPDPGAEALSADEAAAAGADPELMPDPGVHDGPLEHATGSSAPVEGGAGDDTLAGGGSGDEISSTDANVAGTDGDETVTLAADEPEASSEHATHPAPAPSAVQDQSRSSFVPLVLGGVIAVGLGYGATLMGWLPTGGDDEQAAAIAAAQQAQSDTLAALQAQSEAMAALQTQVSELASATPEIPEVDFSPVLEQISAISGRIDGTSTAIAEIADRVAILEERPVFSGDVNEDTAAAAAAVTELEAEFRAQQEAAAARAAELQAQAEAAQAAAAEAEAAAEAATAAAEAEAQAAMAAAEAAAEAAVTQAAAEAALGQVRISFEDGSPFPEAMAALANAVEVPEALGAVAESGVPTLESLEADFAPAARAALPIALRESAGEGATERLAAFLRGQVGGRAIEPREGDDPDAVLSRVGAAVASGDLQTALTEIEALPEGARSEMADWIGSLETRAAADAALASVTAAIADAN